MFSVTNVTSRANSELLNIKAIANDPAVDPVKIAHEYEASISASGFGYLTKVR